MSSNDWKSRNDKVPSIGKSAAAVKPGYKMTEVGVIPEEWEVRWLPEVSWFQEGPGLRNWQFTSSGMKVINVTNLENGFLNLDRTDRHIGIAEFKRMYLHFAIDAFDIVMASSGNSYSKAAVVREQDLPLVMNTSVIRFKPSKLCEYGFLWALLTSPQFKAQIDLMITGGAQPNFGPYHLNRVIVPMPPLPEQRAIATALSDVDALLGGLDRLIAKKRDIKQAAMQQLLTGQTRLPGFHGEWEVKTLGDLFNFSGGYSASRDQLSMKGHCYLHYGDIHGSTKTCIDTDADFQDIPKLDIPLNRVSPGSLLSDGDVVFVDASEDDVGTSKHVVVVNKEKKPFISGLHTIVAKGKTDELAHDYRRYCFQTKAIRDQFLFYSVGTKVSGISKTNIPKLTLPVPSLPEQTAIATVLSDMDAELAGLEQRREKTRALKQGMMQELLTGRIRLVPGIERNIGDEGDISPSFSVSPASSLSPLHPAPPPAKLRHGK
ncbi:MAG TPA: restriction endonuclease subunit S [Kiritimatiellia bacterium]|nr:restriction endonuclease subunit S [Kiritimatiellia bacterium]